jgi:hypothetical protein
MDIRTCHDMRSSLSACLRFLDSSQLSILEVRREAKTFISFTVNDCMRPLKFLNDCMRREYYNSAISYKFYRFFSFSWFRTFSLRISPWRRSYVTWTEPGGCDRDTMPSAGYRARIDNNNTAIWLYDRRLD